MVGMDALSPTDRLKMEASRSIREDFLHQNSFHDIDTYTSLEKQYLMMKLVIGYYNEGAKALENGADIKKLIDLSVREDIGRFKYTEEKDIDKEYKRISELLSAQVLKTINKEEI